VGRPKRAVEQRIAETPEQHRIALIWAKQDVDRATRMLEMSRGHLGSTIAAAADDGVSLRDIAALLELPHQTVYVLRKNAA